MSITYSFLYMTYFNTYKITFLFNLKTYLDLYNKNHIRLSRMSIIQSNINFYFINACILRRKTFYKMCVVFEAGSQSIVIAVRYYKVTIANNSPFVHHAFAIYFFGGFTLLLFLIAGRRQKLNKPLMKNPWKRLILSIQLSL